MDELNADLLFGASKVAAYIGVETRSVYHWMDRRRSGKSAPPVFDVGGQVCARRSELSSWFSGYRDLSRRDESSGDRRAAENYVGGVIRGNAMMSPENEDIRSTD